MTTSGCDGNIKGDVSIPVSVDDAFTVGVSFDLLGGYLLGRGLLASPSEIARRTTQITTWGHGFNAAEAVTHIRSRVDAVAGILGYRAPARNRSATRTPTRVGEDAKGGRGRIVCCHAA